MNLSKRYLLGIALKVSGISLVILPLKKFEIKTLIHFADEVGLTILDLVALGVFLTGFTLVVKNPKDKSDNLYV